MQVYYVVDKPTSFFWRGGKGYITGDIVKKHLPPPSDDNLVLVRDPPLNTFAGQQLGVCLYLQPDLLGHFPTLDSATLQSSCTLNDIGHAWPGVWTTSAHESREWGQSGGQEPGRVEWHPQVPGLHLRPGVQILNR